MPVFTTDPLLSMRADAMCHYHGTVYDEPLARVRARNSLIAHYARLWLTRASTPSQMPPACCFLPRHASNS